MTGIPLNAASYTMEEVPLAIIRLYYAILLDGVFSDSMYLKELNGITGVYPVHPEDLTDYISHLNQSHTMLEHGPYILKAFQFEKVLQLLTQF